MSAEVIQDEQAFSRFVSKRRLRAAYQAVFLSMEGKVVLADLAKRCFVLSTTFVAGPDGDRISAFQEGQRCVFQHIQTLIRKSDDAIRKITEEDWQ